VPRATGATILHADLDAFYASVEQLLDPTLLGKPIAVGGGAGGSGNGSGNGGVVLAASYEAKAFGVRSGMPGWRARSLCPSLTFVGGHFREYQRLGDAVMDVFGQFTPEVERVSIDEAFLDVAGSVHLFGEPAHIAAELRRRVRDELGLPLSVGVATTKHLAKVASQVAKPDGIVVVAPGTEREFLAPLPVGLLWGVGRKTQERLAASGVHTVGELAATSPAVLQSLLGEAVGEKLGALAVNDDPRHIETDRHARSVGAQSALGQRAATDDVLRTTLGFLADRVATRLRAAGQAGRTVTVRVRFPGMRAVTRSSTSPDPVASTLTLTDVAFDLARAAFVDNPAEREVTLLAISVSNLVDHDAHQLALDLDAEEQHADATSVNRVALDHAVDAARSRFGRASLGYATTVLRAEGGVPDEFRELAERGDPRSPD